MLTFLPLLEKKTTTYDMDLKRTADQRLSNLKQQSYTIRVLRKWVQLIDSHLVLCLQVSTFGHHGTPVHSQGEQHRHLTVPVPREPGQSQQVPQEVPRPAQKVPEQRRQALIKSVYLVLNVEASCDIFF